MADIETADGSEGAAREWLARAARAPRDKAWIADGIISDRWAPASPSGALDAFVWRAPDERLERARRPNPRRLPTPAARPFAAATCRSRRRERAGAAAGESDDRAHFDLSQQPIEAKRRLAFFSDEPRLFDYLTVAQHLTFIARIYGVADAMRPSAGNCWRNWRSPARRTNCRGNSRAG